MPPAQGVVHTNDTILPPPSLLAAAELNIKSKVKQDLTH